jgi:glucan phosphoethanolaminetransferase (alkaline phosphatase superfamily)
MLKMAPTRLDVEENLHEIYNVISSHLILVLLALFVARFFYKRYATSLRKVPGPFVASFTRLWKLWQLYKGDTHLTNIELHRKYGIPQLRSSLFQVP